MINCEKASELTSKKIDIKLNICEKISLKFHTLMCSTCSLFEEESTAMSDCLHHHDSVSSKMPESSKNKLKELLNKNQ